jgi:hypothetical protein
MMYQADPTRSAAEAHPLKTRVLGSAAAGDAASTMGNEQHTFKVPASSSDDPATFCSAKLYALMHGLLYYSPIFQAHLTMCLQDEDGLLLTLETLKAALHEVKTICGDNYAEPTEGVQHCTSVRKGTNWANLDGTIPQEYNSLLETYSEVIKDIDTLTEASEIYQAAQTVQLTLRPQDRNVLEAFHDKMKAGSSRLADHYKTLTFEAFIVRLATKRYGMAYLDARFASPRTQADLEAFQAIITTMPQADQADPIKVNQYLLAHIHEHPICHEYLSPIEFMVSPLVGVSMTTPMCHTGYRPGKGEAYPDTTKIENPEPVTLTYPAGVEYRNWKSAGQSPDTLGTVLEQLRSNSMLENINSIGKTLLGEHFDSLLEQIYTTGDTTTKDQLLERAYPDPVARRDIKIKLAQTAIDLRKWTTRTQGQLELQILTTLKAQSDSKTPGIIQFKGLGLGAFGCAEKSRGLPDDLGTQLFQIAVQDAIQNTQSQWAGYVTAFEVINLPSDLKDHMAASKYDNSQDNYPSIIAHEIAIPGSEIRLFRTCNLYPYANPEHKLLINCTPQRQAQEAQAEAARLAAEAKAQAARETQTAQIAQQKTQTAQTVTSKSGIKTHNKTVISAIALLGLILGAIMGNVTNIAGFFSFSSFFTLSTSNSIMFGGSSASLALGAIGGVLAATVLIAMGMFIIKNCASTGMDDKQHLLTNPKQQRAPAAVRQTSKQLAPAPAPAVQQQTPDQQQKTQKL